MVIFFLSISFFFHPTTILMFEKCTVHLYTVTSPSFLSSTHTSSSSPFHFSLPLSLFHTLNTLKNGSLYAVHALVECGCDVRVADNSGRTAMHYAAQIGAL